MDEVIPFLCALLIWGSAWLQWRLLCGCWRNRGTRLWRTVIIIPWSCCAILVLASIPFVVASDVHNRFEFVMACAFVFFIVAAKATLSIFALGVNAASWLASWHLGHKIVGNPISVWVQNIVEDVLPENVLWWTTIAGFLWAAYNLKATTFEKALRELWLT